MGNPVVDFLTTRNGYTFEEGVAVLALYTKDRYAVERVRRSHDIRLLNHELKKLAHVPGLKSMSGNDITKVEPVKIVEPEKKEIKSSVNDEMISAKDNVSYAELHHYKFTRFEDMPTEETKQLWQRNNERWHQKLFLFAKMKLLPEGDELKATRKELLEVSREHRDAWKLIDKKISEFFAQKSKTDKNTEPEKPSFNISTYRTYICEKAKMEKLSDKQFLELQRRVDAMLQAGIALSDETLKALQEKNIRC